jgi:hypothetical protein
LYEEKDMRRSILFAGLTILLAALAVWFHGNPAVGAEASRVTLWHLPGGAIQPQAAVDSKGVVHIIYFKNGAAEGEGDLFYIRLAPGQTSASEPIRVNSQRDTAGSVGTVRTAQVAVGQGDRVHVVWNGLGPKGSNGYPTTYQAYTRLNAAGTAFEPQRDLITWAKGLDGGGSVASDRKGNVYVTWHAMANAMDESGRAVFVARSTDNGGTFAKEKQANPEPAGACACCGMRSFVDSKGVLYVLYRTATNRVDRDTTLLLSRDKGETFAMKRLDRWNINACPMSTYAMAENKSGVVAAWETAGRIYTGTIDATDLTVSSPAQAPGSSQKHPSVTANGSGQTLLAWTEGTGWKRGGTLVWQLVDKDGAPVATGKKIDAIPVWGLPSAYSRPDGTFVIVY